MVDDNPNSFVFEDVAITLGVNEIWSQGNFAIKKGTVTAIIGSNGAGKTTLARLLLRILEPTSGKITINEPNIGYVPQKYDTDNDFMITGLDYIRASCINGETTEMIERAVQQVHASDFVKKRLSTLSGGQRQRIAIASALASNSQMLILDEPLSSLDIKSAKEIVSLLQKLNHDLGITIAVIAHDLGLLLPILTGAIYLVDGHAHYAPLDDAEHADYGDLLEHLRTMKVGEHEL